MKLGIFNRLDPLGRLLLTMALLFSASFAYAESEYAEAWGPSVGAKAPVLSALDQDGNQQNLKSMSGSNGLLFVFNRSVDW